MRNSLISLAVVGLLLTATETASASVYRFRFTEEDLWNHTPSADSALYDQDAPRRHHTTWKSDVQTTDAAQPNQSEYARQLGMGTNGWRQSDTYDNWLAAGPEDNLGNAFGFTEVQLWGAGYPNGQYAWAERFKLADVGAAAWEILLSPAGWSGEIVLNPWPDPAFGDEMYFPVWQADSYEDRILYEAYGDGVEDYVFEFAVDIAGEYPTPLEELPDGDPFEEDDSLRIWFGGNALNPAGEWSSEGFDGTMGLKPVPEPSTLIVSALLVGLAIAAGWWRRRRKAA